MKALYFTRHGQTVWNVENKICGATDIGLTELGHEQAIQLGKELKARIEAAETLVVLEDLYRPYKQKRKTRASVAKEKGLEPLAAYILEQNAAAPLTETAQAYVDTEKGVADAKEAIDGAKDIIAEQISDEADYRIYIRNLTFEEGKIVSAAEHAPEYLRLSQAEREKKERS